MKKIKSPPFISRRSDINLTRRELLNGSGILAGFLIAGSPLALLAPSRAWAVELQTLTTAQGEALMAFGRTLYPQDKFPDAVYGLLVKDLDAKATVDVRLTQVLRDGLARLEFGAAGSFAFASPSRQLGIVKSLEGTVFFNTVRGQCVTSLYDNDMAFAALGYPGSSWDKGGYIMRGFQDLKWLDEPPLSASPKSFAS